MTRKLLAFLILPGLLLLTHALPARSDATDAQPPISTLLPLFQTGMGWAATEYTTGVAFGDVDGDGRDEVAVTRNALSGARLFVFDDAAAGFAPLWTFGDSWGAGAYATSVAFGDVDGDGRDEIGLTRATSVNERAYVFDDATAGFAIRTQLGRAWGPAVHAIRIAFGDADGDGQAEFAVATNATSGPRVFVFGSAAETYAPLWDAGGDWGAAAVATSVAFGDSDGDDADEVGITRRHDSNTRIFLYDGDGAFLEGLGETWGAGSWATDIAFGNVDNDAADEMGVTRRSGINERAYVFDDAAADFATLARFGETWNQFAYATAVAFGDVDGDGRDEVAVAREVTINRRFFVYDDALAAEPFRELAGGGETWTGPEHATAIALGNADDVTGAEVAVGRRAETGPRAWVFTRGWSVRLPLAIGKPPAEATPSP